MDLINWILELLGTQQTQDDNEAGPYMLPGG